MGQVFFTTGSASFEAMRRMSGSWQYSSGRIWVMSVLSRYVTGWKQPMRPSNSRFISSVSTASS